LVSQIGKPISEPQAASIQLVVPKANNDYRLHLDTAKAVAEDVLDNLDNITKMILKDELTVF